MLLPLFFLIVYGVTAHSVPGYNRTIFYYKDIDVATNTPESTLDFNHTKAKTFGDGLYSEAEAAALFPTAVNFVIQRFGFNFSQGIYVPSLDAWMLPGYGIMFPICFGADRRTRLGYDEGDDTDRDIGRNGNWIVFTVGHVVQITGTGTYTSGTAALTNMTYAPGDILGINEQNYLDTNRQHHWNRPGSRSRRRLLIRSLFPSKIVPSGQPGISHTLVNDHYIDPDTNEVGFGAGILLGTRSDDGQMFIQSSRNLITFPRVNNIPIPASNKRSLGDEYQLPFSLPY